MVAKIFIDGQQGTTGLEIQQRLAQNKSIQLLNIPEPQRKEPQAKAAVYAQADLVVLCLPDEAAKQAARLANDLGTKVLDASTAHRTHPDWVYGLPEIAPTKRAEIALAPRVSNPGCYASGCILGLQPLLQSGFLSPNQHCTIFAVSGYSGGGRQLIKKYTQPPANFSLYSLTQEHKHVKEIQHHLGLVDKPHFTPAVNNQFRGMLCVMPFFKTDFNRNPSLQDLEQCIKDYYAHEPLIQTHSLNATDSTDNVLHQLTTPTDKLELFCLGDNNHFRLIARLDNLGKGACGVALQNIHLMLHLK